MHSPSSEDPRFQQDPQRHLRYCIAQGFVDFAQQSELMSDYSQTSRIAFFLFAWLSALFCFAQSGTIVSRLFYSISTDKQTSRQTDSKSKPK